MPRPKIRPSAIDRALAKVVKSRKRLVTDQGMVARRHAREEVLSNVREFRRIFDRDFPIIAKKRKPRRKHTKIRNGFTLLTLHAHGSNYQKWLTWMAEAKTPLQVIRRTSTTAVSGTYVPEWAVAICERFGKARGSAPSALRKAKKDRSFREVELAAFKLSQDQA